MEKACFQRELEIRTQEVEKPCSVRRQNDFLVMSGVERLTHSR